MMENSAALDLLSLEDGGSGDSSDKARERLLAATILDSRTSLWKHKVSDLHTVISESCGNPDSCAWLLPLFAESIRQSSDEQLKENYSKWTTTLVQCLQACKQASTVKAVCGGLHSLLDRVKDSQDVVRDFTLNQLPAIVRALLWFNGADPLLQCHAMQVAARCVDHFTASASQYKTQLRKWATSGLFGDKLWLSQECGRLLVLLCLNNSVQWKSLTESLVGAFHRTLANIYQPVLDIPPPSYASSSIELPPLQTEEPRRCSVLVLEIAVISQTLCYALMFPPPATDTTEPTGINLERALGVAMFGLSVQQQQVTGHSSEKLLLGAVLSIIHTAAWNVTLALIEGCESHLLPYSSHIESNLVLGMTETAQNLKTDNFSPRLSLAIHKALVAWVKMKKYFDASFLAPVVKSLIQFYQLPPTTKVHSEVRLSGLTSLLSLVKVTGPILPQSVAVVLSRLPLDSLPPSPSPSLPPHETRQLLELLLECVTSGNLTLTVPLSMALQIFNENCTPARGQEVMDFCQSAIARCTLLQHPVVVPIPPPPSSSLLPSSSAMGGSTTSTTFHPSTSYFPHGENPGTRPMVTPPPDRPGQTGQPQVMTPIEITQSHVQLSTAIVQSNEPIVIDSEDSEKIVIDLSKDEEEKKDMSVHDGKIGDRSASGSGKKDTPSAKSSVRRSRNSTPQASSSGSSVAPTTSSAGKTGSPPSTTASLTDIFNSLVATTSSSAAKTSSTNTSFSSSSVTATTTTSAAKTSSSRSTTPTSTMATQAGSSGSGNMEMMETEEEGGRGEKHDRKREHSSSSDSDVDAELALFVDKLANRHSSN